MFHDNFMIMNAAGMVKTLEDVRKLLPAPVTHIVLGSIAVEARSGNPEPNFWVAPDESYALNARGLPGPGIEYYERHGEQIADEVHAHAKKLVVSITSTESEDDWVKLAERANAIGADVLEVNLSCPNKWKGAVNEPVVAQNPKAVSEILSAIRTVWGKEAWAKLPPYKRANMGILENVLDAIENNPFVRALVSGNTVGGCSTIIDGTQVISMPTAGMSGPKVFPWALRQAQSLAKMSHLPVIGVGGINSGKSLHAFMKEGVVGVQIGTHFFLHGPKVFGEILGEAVSMVEG